VKASVPNVSLRSFNCRVWVGGAFVSYAGTRVRRAARSGRCVKERSRAFIAETGGALDLTVPPGFVCRP
jgi:hypothetical protein